MCVCRGFENSARSRGEGVKSRYRTKDLITSAGAGSLCRDLGTLVKCNKNELCDYMTTEQARLARVPVLCRDPRCLPGGLTNEPSEKQDSG